MTGNKSPNIVTIIVHYNAPEECIGIVTQLLTINHPNHRIVVVDNPSNPDAFQKIKTQISDSRVHVIQNHANNGYGAGVNFGAIYAQKLKADYYHVINTDTGIINPNYIESIIENFNNSPSAALIGPGVMTSTGEVQNTIMPFISINNAIKFKLNKKIKSLIETSPRLYPAEVINGVCFIVRAEMFHKIGGFDEDFFMYGEEHDFCYRLKKSNYTCHYLSENAIYHSEAHKTKDRIFTWRHALVRVNQVLFLKKRHRRIEALVLALLFSISITIKRATLFSFPNISYISVIRGFFNPHKFNRSIMDKLIR